MCECEREEERERKEYKEQGRCQKKRGSFAALGGEDLWELDPLVFVKKVASLSLTNKNDLKESFFILSVFVFICL